MFPLSFGLLTIRLHDDTLQEYPLLNLLGADIAYTFPLQTGTNIRLGNIEAAPRISLTASLAGWRRPLIECTAGYLSCPPVGGWRAGYADEMPHRQSSDAPMSPYELRALRYLWRGMPQFIEEANRALLIGMGLAKLNTAGTLEITEAGRDRFTVERHRSDAALAGASAPTAVAATSREGRAA